MLFALYPLYIGSVLPLPPDRRYLIAPSSRNSNSLVRTSHRRWLGLASLGFAWLRAAPRLCTIRYCSRPNMSPFFVCWGEFSMSPSRSSGPPPPSVAHLSSPCLVSPRFPGVCVWVHGPWAGNTWAQVSMIEKAMRDVHFSAHPTRSAKQQVSARPCVSHSQ